MTRHCHRPIGSFRAGSARVGPAGAVSLIFVLLGAPLAVHAQDLDDLFLSGSNRMEYGLTRQEGDESFEDLFRLDAGWRRWSIATRLHLVQPSEGPNEETIDQRSLQYADEHLEVLGGNFYETWGRGLVLRAYETRSATVGRLERSVALDRDIDGLRLRGRTGAVNGTLLSGRPLVTPLSGEPGFEEPAERRDTLRGARLAIGPDGLFGGDGFAGGTSIGAAGSYLRVNIPDETNAGGSLRDEYLAGELDLSRGAVTGHLSYAHRAADLQLLPEDGRAWYGALSASAGAFGLSWEYKDYERFVSLYNEPPTLVKTQTWTLLNRETHLSNADDEVGHQAALEWSSGGEDGLALNHSRSDNHDGDDVFAYRQWTLEGRRRFGADGARLRAVADWTEDPVRGEVGRFSTGGELELFFDDRNSAALVVEWQQTDRRVSETERRTLVTLEYQRAPWLTLALQGETTSVPVDGRDRWGGATVNLAFSGRHNLNVFYGRRPAGFVCTGGYCFFAPAFDGLELRLISLFGG